MSESVHCVKDATCNNYFMSSVFCFIEFRGTGNFLQTKLKTPFQSFYLLYGHHGQLIKWIYFNLMEKSKDIHKSITPTNDKY